MHFRLLNIVLLGLICSFSYGQTDRTFWFAAPDVSSVHGPWPDNGAPINLHITALFDTRVRISRPADATFTPIEFDLAEMEHTTLRMDNTVPGGLMDIDEIECYEYDNLLTGMEDKGFLIEASPGEITAYYELDNINNRDIFPLKGLNALGRDFWVTTQNYYPNGDYSGTAWSGFVILATENNTKVIVEQNDGWLHFSTPATRVITLNRGETFVFRAESTAANRHIAGVHVTSNKDIAITYYDDSVHRTPDGCKDIIGDQIVPTDIIGQEYLVMKGFLSGEERIFVTATQNTTAIWIDGIHVDDLDAGDVGSYVVSNRSTHVWADNPIYVNHVTGFGCEVGGALLPSIDGCTGSNSVTFTRTPTTSDAFYLNIMVRNDTNDLSPFHNQSIQNFTLEVDNSVMAIPATYFEYIPDSTFAVLRDDPTVHNFFSSRINAGNEAQITNSFARFHLGVINGGPGNGCKYGYFSDYAANPASAGLGGATAVTQQVYCNMDPIQLVAAGGIGYNWSGVSDPSLTDHITDTTIAAPFFYPPATGDYMFSVQVYGECFSDTTIYIRTIVKNAPTSNFELDQQTGCSPFATGITNTSTGTPDKSLWFFNSIHNVVNQDTLANPFDWQFPLNTSDTAQSYYIELRTYATFSSCESVRRKYVTILPNVTADFSITDSVGCHPVSVDFTSSSTGHLDSTSYLWDFGDNSQSFEEDPSHVFSNFSFNDTTYTVQLITESPLGCLDTLTKGIQVYPRVRAAMAINASASCSPLDITINPSSSTGVDTFFWHVQSPAEVITDPDIDTIYSTTNKVPVSVIHRDITYLSPDTILVNLVGMNRFGCVDSFPQRNIVVFPEVNTLFDIQNDTICDGDSIRFNNTSTGYELFYNWDFDDGTIAQDTLGDSLSHLFFNRTANTQEYRVTLRATSGYSCENTHDTVVVVHPFVQANFGMNYINNCTPVEANFTNLSIRGDYFEWDFGDGQNSTTSDSLFTHQYWNDHSAQDTTYLVQLIVSNKEGCSDTTMRSISVLPHVVANFSVDDNVGCSPFYVNFSDSSSGGLSYLWDFGDGTTSTNPTPTTKRFTNYTHQDTSYYVELTVANSFGCDSSFQDTIEVYAYIDADFNVPLADSCSPFRLDIENLSSIGAHFWDWELEEEGVSLQTITNDSTPDFGILTNTTLQTDTFMLRLMAYGVNDAAHRTCADYDSIRVLIFPELDVNFNLDTAMAQCQPLNGQLQNTTNIRTADGTYFQWFIDSVFYTALETPSNRLNIPNLTSADVDHTILLTGESRHGCTDTHQETMTVYSLVDAQFTLNAAGICSADSFEIDRRTTRGGTGIAHYYWQLGNTATVVDDATEVFPVSFENLFSNTPTTEALWLTVENNAGCRDSIRKSIQVYPEVRAIFNFADNTLCYPEAANITNGSQNATFFIWDFDDGTGANGASPTVAPHVFENFSTTDDSIYTVQLIARSDYNCYDSIEHNITIYAKPEAQFFFPVTVDCPPFDASITNESEGSNLSYFWTLDATDTTYVSDPAPFLVSNSNGHIREVPVTLQVTSDRGCIDTLSRSFSVYPNVEVDFAISDSIGCSPHYIDFTGDAPNANNQIWYIDGQAFSTLLSPSYRFVNNTANLLQDFEVTFQASSVYGCSDTIVKDVHIYSTPDVEFFPDPVVTAYDTVNDRTDIQFENTTYLQNIWQYAWDFGDGNTSNEPGAVFTHSYGDRFWGSNDNNNVITVNLRAWNADNSACEDSYDYDIRIRPPLPQVALSKDIEGCQPFTVEFPSTTKYNYEDSHNWNFGTVDGDASSEEFPIFTYHEPGVYIVELEVEGDGGSNFDTRKVTVYPKPVIDYTFNDSIVLSESQNSNARIINFYNHTEHGQDYQWFFDLESKDTAAFSEGIRMGDYEPDTYEREPSWAFPNVGVFYTAQIATSNQGCHDTLIHPIAINVLSGGRLRFPTGFFVDPGAPRDSYVGDPEDPSRNLFRAYGEGVAEFKLEIYNRWGVLVFETNDMNEGWNGFLEGEPAKQDVYIWRCKGTFTDGEPFLYSGDVTLILAPDNGQVH